MKTPKLFNTILLIIFLSISFCSFSQIKNKEILALCHQPYISGIGWDEWSDWSYPAIAINLKVADNNAGLVLDMEVNETSLRFKMYEPTETKVGSNGSYIYKGSATGLFSEGMEETCSYSLIIKEGTLKDLYKSESDNIYTLLIEVNNCERGEPSRIGLRVY
jgi:hypothetical protein